MLAAGPAILTNFLLFPQALGIVIIAGGSVVKLPQIIALLKSKSAAGISELSVELENLALMVHASYGFLMGLPLNTYGEAAIMLLQNSVLLALMYRCRLSQSDLR